MDKVEIDHSQNNQDLYELIVSISSELAQSSLDHIPSAVQMALQRLGEYAGVDRVYIFDFTLDYTSFSNTYEWCSEGTEPQIDELKDIPIEHAEHWLEAFRNNESIYIPLVADLPYETDNDKKIKDILEPQGIISLLVLPLFYGKQLTGFIGYDTIKNVRKWSQEQMALLRLVGEIIAGAISRQSYEQSLIQEQRKTYEANLELAYKNEQLEKYKQVLEQAFTASTQMSMCRSQNDAIDIAKKTIVNNAHFAEQSASASFDRNQFIKKTTLVNQTVSLPVGYAGHSLGVLSLSGYQLDHLDSLDSQLVDLVSSALALCLENIKYSNSLEDLVAERSAQLRTEMNTISTLMNNMQQAVFSIKADGVIIPPVSAYSQNVFAVPIEGQLIWDVLYKNLERTSETYSLLKDNMSLVFGEAEFQWDLSSAHFPMYIDYKSVDANDVQKLKVSYRPIWSEDHLLEKVMFVVEDITQLLKLEERVKAEKEQSAKKVQIIQELNSNSAQDLFSFFCSISEFINYTKSFRQLRSINRDNLVDMLQQLHAIKGNARLLALSQISQAIHSVEGEIEAQFQSYKKQVITKNDLIDQLDHCLKSVSKEIDAYKEVAEKVLKLNLQESHPEQLIHGEVESILEHIECAQGNSSSLNVDMIKQTLNKLVRVPMQSILNRFEYVVRGGSQPKDKDIVYKVESEPIYIRRELVETLTTVLNQLVRNAVAHGVESSSERLNSGKSPTAEVRATAKLVNGRCQVSIQDDGRGIDEEYLIQKAQKMQLLSEHEVADLKKSSHKEKLLKVISLPGLSSAETATELSGRGIGFEVVLQNLNVLGADLEIESQPNKGTSFSILFDPTGS
jgi:transcriptional regulator with GAF, ATPase, and Fis domain/signal transduction histidine kinase